MLRKLESDTGKVGLVIINRTKTKIMTNQETSINAISIDRQIIKIVDSYVYIFGTVHRLNVVAKYAFVTWVYKQRTLKKMQVYKRSMERRILNRTLKDHNPKL